MLKLETGKRYWRRDGGVSGPLRHNKESVRSFRVDDGLNSWYEEGRFTNSQERPYDLIREYTEPQPLEWKRGIPTEEECRECWLVDGLSGSTPCEHRGGDIYEPNGTTQDDWHRDEWYIAIRIKPVEPQTPKTVTQRQYISETREELWTQHDVDICWKPTGLTREVEQ